MKMLIDNPIKVKRIYNGNDSFTPEEIDEVYEDFLEFSKMLNSFCLWHIGVIDKNSYEIKIHPQKCTIEEGVMADLLYDLHETFEGLKIEYAPLGGHGCDFTFRLTQDLPSIKKVCAEKV